MRSWECNCILKGLLWLSLHFTCFGKLWSYKVISGRFFNLVKFFCIYTRETLKNMDQIFCLLIFLTHDPVWQKWTHICFGVENKNKRIKNCILEEVTCIGFFFFIPNVDKHRTNKQPDPELVYDDSPRKHCGSHTRQLASQLPCPRPPLMERKRRKTEGTSVLRRQPRWAAHVPAGGENAAKNRLYKLPTCLLFRGFVIYTTNQDIIPENLLSNLKGVVRCVSLNKWISFAGRSSRNIVHLPNS